MSTEPEINASINHSMLNSAPEVNASSNESFVTKVTRSLRDMMGGSGNSPLPSRKWVLVLSIACLVAIGTSGYLGFVALTSSKVAGCGGGKLFNCGHVISSRWSLWLGIPVSMLAVGTYLSLAISLFFGSSSRFSNSVRHIGWAMVTILAMSAGAAALWFVSIQVFALGHLCTYCLVAHTCGLVAAATVLWTRPVGVSGLKPAAVLSIVGVTVLIVGQLLTAEPDTFRFETYEPPAAGSEVFEFEAPIFEAPEDDQASFVPLSLPMSTETKQTIVALLNPAVLLSAYVAQETPQQDESKNSSTSAQSDTEKFKATSPIPKAKAQRRMVSINGGSVQLDVSQWPISGSKDAKYIFAEMFDYSCPHCRHTHAAIKGASKRLNGDMAVVVLPIPLSAACNNAIQVTDPKFTESCEIAKLAVAVWRIDSVKFTEFHNWMFSTEASPTYAMAKAQADTLVDAEKLNAELASAVPSQYIAKTVELYKRAGAGNVPKLIFPTTSIVGAFTSDEALVDIIKQQIKN